MRVSSVIKTRIQTVYGRQKYQNAFKCLILTAKEDGITRLWSGATPRLGRLMVSQKIQDHYKSIVILTTFQAFWWDCFFNF